MEIVCCRDTDSATELTARLVQRRLLSKPETVLGLATGRTMEGVYARLVESGVSFAQASTFNLDEYVGLSPDDADSYAAYMRAHLFDHVDVHPSRTYLPDGMAGDLRAAAENYEAAIRAAGGIDLQLLGIGSSGHIGFNEPLSALRSRTRDKILTPATRAQNAEMFGGDPDRVPKRALTMGVATILEARQIVLLACGTAKADVVAAATEGPLTARISASAIQMHPACTVILDPDAASALTERGYYGAIRDAEEKWDQDRDLF